MPNLGAVRSDGHRTDSGGVGWHLGAVRSDGHRTDSGGVGWVRFFLAESQSGLYRHMRAKFGRDPTAGSKKVSFKFIIGWICRNTTTSV